jgi:hypothetical protein
MSALSLVTTPPEYTAEVVTNSARLYQFRSLAGLTFQHSPFLKSSVRRLTSASVSPRKKALWESQATPPNSALVLSGTPGTGRFLF